MNGLVVKKISVLKPLTVLSLEEKRLFAFCLQYYDSRVDATNPNVFEITLDEFRAAYPEYVKRKPIQIFHACKKAINGIQTKPYEPPLKKDEEGGEAIYWFSKLKVTKEKIRFGLNPEVMPFFLNIKNHFISYHMSDVRLLGKPSAWNLYEYIKEKYMSGLCLEWTVEVDDLKDRLGVLGKYERFGDFDTYCLKRPINEINKHTDLKVEYNKVKRGVKIHAIIFTVTAKAADPNVIDTEDQSKVFARELLTIGINPKVVENFVKLAADQKKTGAMLKKIPAAKKSWRKHGKGPWPAYLSGIMQRELLERNLFENNTVSEDRKRRLEQEKCWSSQNVYGCKFVGTRGTKTLCEGCIHNE
jgi:plasmid replication initiation protein